MTKCIYGNACAVRQDHAEARAARADQLQRDRDMLIFMIASRNFRADGNMIALDHCDTVIQRIWIESAECDLKKAYVAMGDAAPPELTPEEDAADLRLARMARWGIPPEVEPSSSLPPRVIVEFFCIGKDSFVSGVWGHATIEHLVEMERDFREQGPPDLNDGRKFVPNWVEGEDQEGTGHGEILHIAGWWEFEEVDAPASVEGEDDGTFWEMNPKCEESEWGSPGAVDPDSIETLDQRIAKMRWDGEDETNTNL